MGDIVLIIFERFIDNSRDRMQVALRRNDNNKTEVDFFTNKCESSPFIPLRLHR